MAGPSMVMAVAGSSDDFIPFLHVLASTFNVPFPHIYRAAPAFTFIAAPSKASAVSVSVEFSSSGFSDTVIVPYADHTVNAVNLPVAIIIS